MKYTICVQPVFRNRRNKTPERRRLPPNLNARMHWSLRRWWSKQFREQSFVLCKEQRVPPLGKARIEMVNYTTRPMDRDNLYGAFKSILDGIVDAQVITDDDDEHLDLRCRNVRVSTKGEEAVVITIEPWEDD